MKEKGLFDLSGKVVLVTGGGSGLGRSICEAMAEYGADVICVGKTMEKIEETVDLIKAHGTRVKAIPADVSDQAQVERVIDRAVAGFGTIDVVFASAAIREVGFQRIHEKPIEDWDLLLHVNLRSVFLLMRAVFPIMISKRGGNFISISSIGGLWPVADHEFPKLNTAYSVAKAGVIMLTKLAARQYAENNIRVNVICPGYHETGLTPPEEKEALEAELIPHIPLARAAKAEEIKGLAVWLASDASSYVTGQILIQDGGVYA
ncbi:MAG: SDR family oxidoreductase [Deltaproteobacteria bacterium]|nr:SDR family oxidoreductase [Deltaproteobacteria bacterium]